MTKVLAMGPGPRQRAPLFAALAGVVALAACEVPNIPSSPPSLDLRWIVPAQSSSIAVSNLLPAGVSILPDGSAFTISIAPTSVTRTLGQDCGTCAAANGLTVPKPAFIGSSSQTTTIPSDVASATIASGSLVVAVRNNYTFDPLRPTASGTPRGYAVITVTSGATLLGKDSVDGSTIGLPVNTTLSRVIPLSGQISGSTPVTVAVTLNSPAGDPVLIDASRTIVVTATPTDIRVASANVNVANRTVSSTSSIDLTKVDGTITSRTDSAKVLLTVANPFAVAGNLTVSLQPDNGTPIVKNVTLSTGNSSPTISLNKAEITALFGHNVVVTYSGAVNSTGTVNISPKQAVVLQTKLDVSLHVGG